MAWVRWQGQAVGLPSASPGVSRGPSVTQGMTLATFKETGALGKWWRKEPRKEGLTSWRCQTSLWLRCPPPGLSEGARDGQ